MSKFIDIKGTSLTSFQVQLAGPRIANESGHIATKNAANNAYVDLIAAILRAAGESLVLNNDAAGAGADWTYTISRPVAGMTANVALVLPVDDGTNGQVLGTDGAGNLSWVTPTVINNTLMAAEYDLAWGDAGGQHAMFTLPAGSIIKEVLVIIDTPFDTAATVSVGILGTVDKYMLTTANALNGAAKDRYEANPNEAAPVAPESVTVNYTAAGAGAGAARIIAIYTNPA